MKNQMAFYLIVVFSLLIFAACTLPQPPLPTTPPRTIAPSVPVSPPTSTSQPTSTIDPVAATVAAIGTARAQATAVAATLTAMAPTPTRTPTRPIIIIPPTRTPAPYQMIINHHTQKCLTVQGKDVVQASCTGSNNQMWRYQPGYDPRQFVTSSGACLSFSDIDIVISGSGCPIWTVRQWGDYWTIQNARIQARKEPHPHINPTPLQLGIYFQIVDGGNCVDLDGWNHDEGGKLIYWPCDGRITDNANQLWSYYQK